MIEVEKKDWPASKIEAFNKWMDNPIVEDFRTHLVQRRDAAIASAAWHTFAPSRSEKEKSEKEARDLTAAISVLEDYMRVSQIPCSVTIITRT